MNALTVQQNVAEAIAIIEAALEFAGFGDLVPILQSIQTLEQLVVDAIDQKKPIASTVLQGEVATADAAAKAAEALKFPGQ